MIVQNKYSVSGDYKKVILHKSKSCNCNHEIITLFGKSSHEINSLLSELTGFDLLVGQYSLINTLVSINYTVLWLLLSRELQCATCYNISDVGVASLTSCIQLSYLDISYCNNVRLVYVCIVLS